MKPTAILLQANRTAIILNMTQKAKNQQKPKKKSHLKSKNHNRESNLGEKKNNKTQTDYWYPHKNSNNICS